MQITRALIISLNCYTVIFLGQEQILGQDPEPLLMGMIVEGGMHPPTTIANGK